jgi:hypothetical protein
MSIHYHKASGRFRDDSGRFVSKERAQRSSVARAEFAAAHKPPASPQAERRHVRTYGRPKTWFPPASVYDWEDFDDDWGDYEFEETDS